MTGPLDDDDDDDGGGGDGDGGRWAALERRVAALEAAASRPGSPGHGDGGAGRDHGPAAGTEGEPATFWALEELRRQVAAQELPGGAVPVTGAVLFTGTVQTPAGAAEWQLARAAADLLDDASLDALEAPAAALAALGNPVRLLLLARVLGGSGGSATAADLAADDALGTSGQVYHHLRQLVAAGWLRSAARGRYAVPPERVVPLLVALALAGR